MQRWGASHCVFFNKGPRKGDVTPGLRDSHIGTSTVTACAHFMCENTRSLCRMGLSFKRSDQQKLEAPDVQIADFKIHEPGP